MYNNDKPKYINIDPEASVIFVADLFVNDYVGGAELTSEALIESAPFKVQKIHSKDVTMELLEQGHQKYWIFGNCSQVNYKILPAIITNLNYSILEYDYKFCRYRSMEKHFAAEGAECNCQKEPHGQLIGNFFYHAKSLWWMSEAQLAVYEKRFPYLRDRDNVVLSSVFGDRFWNTLYKIREDSKNTEKKGWIVLGSTSWVKGAETAENWCKTNKKEYEVVWNVPYEDLLIKLSKAEGFVYLPSGSDTCPRMVIEAKLLGCKLVLNDKVQHAKEIWFDNTDLLETESYLYAARDRFWNAIVADMNYVPTLSGYTTTYNCVAAGYPFEASISSMAAVCDEVIVLDGGSNDGTWERLNDLASSNEKIKISQHVVNWEHPRFAIEDGLQKARARNLCQSEYCWQQDADEIIHEEDVDKIKKMLQQFPKHCDLVSLPVIEYWGGYEKIRMDITPWKWRLSRNNPNITHGIPKALRVESNNDSYAKPGTDGCDYIFKDSGNLVPHANFYGQDAHNARMAALQGNADAHKAYGDWFKRNLDLLPAVHHYSWFNLERKIKTYKNYWSKHWQSLYNITQEDTVENNMFFDKRWVDVTDQDIRDLAASLKDKLGGWVFHEKINWDIQVPFLKYEIQPPKYYKGSLDENSNK